MVVADAKSPYERAEALKHRMKPPVGIHSISQFVDSQMARGEERGPGYKCEFAAPSQ